MQEDGQGPNEDVYVYAEKEAALLGWVWGLSCPVINRYPPELWFERIESLEFWRGRLERFGLELTAVGIGANGFLLFSCRNRFTGYLGPRRAAEARMHERFSY